MTAPSATIASYLRLCASLRATTGMSNAPGARTISICLSPAPWRLSASTAPRINWSTMKSLKRAARIAKRSSRHCKSPSMLLMLSIHVLHHFEIEAGQTVHLLRRRQNAHSRHAEVTQDLRADAVRAQHLRARMRRRRHGIAADALYGVHQIARRFVRTQDHDHAVTFLRDPLHRRAQWPSQRAIADPDDVAERVLEMHAHQRYALAVQLARNQRQMHRAVDVVLVAEHAEFTELGRNDLLGNALHRALLLQPVADQIGDRPHLELVLPRELLQVRPPRHRAVFIEDLDDRRRRLEPREPRQVAAGLGMTGAGQHTAGLRHDREDVARLPQVLGARVAA